MSHKKKERGSFLKQFFQRYDVVITQRGGRDVERRMVTSRFVVSLTFVLGALLVATVTVLLLFYTSLQSFMPGYVSPEIRRQIVDTSLKLDSLSEAVHRQHLYVMNIQDIFRGEVKVDSVSSIDSLTVLRSEHLMERTVREKEFARKYEETEKYNLTSQAQRKSDMEGIHFYPPMRGLLADAFDADNHHLGVDIVASDAHQNVCAVLDGTVLMSDYTAGNGYVVMVQHVGNMVTIYRHLSALFPAEGDKVKAGDALGIVGKQGSKHPQAYMHFELWHKGTALDPMQYITF